MRIVRFNIDLSFKQLDMRIARYLIELRSVRTLF